MARPGWDCQKGSPQQAKVPVQVFFQAHARARRLRRHPMKASPTSEPGVNRLKTELESHKLACALL